MKRSLCVSIILILFPVISYAEMTQGDNAFPAIEETAERWYEGRFGSTLYYESKLDDLLWRMRGKRIDIPAEFIISKPETTGNISLVSTFERRKWLEIRTTISKVEIEHLRVKYPETRWWRFAKITGVSGRIRKYRIDRGFTIKRLILYVDNFEFTSVRK
ncbi:MAG TPA: hypothetical protein PKK43_06315 [Spirochaetota bacterium]|nr:hypothetical protein [Spirochaetota bacterium]